MSPSRIRQSEGFAGRKRSIGISTPFESSVKYIQSKRNGVLYETGDSVKRNNTVSILHTQTQQADPSSAVAEK